MLNGKLKPVGLLSGSALWLSLLLASVASSATGPLQRAVDSRVLARVELGSLDSPLPLTTHALLQDARGRDYALVLATKTELARAGRPWRLLATGVEPEECLLATEMIPGARDNTRGTGDLLLDDGLRLLLRAGLEEAERLAEAGFAIQRLTQEPVEWPVSGKTVFHGSSRKWDPDAMVAAMVAAVQPTNLYTMVVRLSGVQPELTGGKPQVVTSRHTNSRLPLTNALALAYARFDALGLQPVYHRWTTASYTNRNLSATLRGGARSNELVLITAHLDDMPSGALAPGADDNASGCAGVLTAAGVFAQYQFERSIRFVLFTGEEQGLLGSANYAAAARSANDNIVAVLNLDMIGWDGSKPATFQLHTRTTGNAGYASDLAIASAFTNAAATYSLTAIAPVIKADGLNASDHYSFWNRNYPAIAATEDYTSDFCPYYHTVNDTVAGLNMAYFTDAVRASVAAVAHLAVPTGRTFSSVLGVANSDWSTTSGIGGAILVARHWPHSAELGPEPFDLAVTDTPANPNDTWLGIDTAPYGIHLAVDSRPTSSESIFAARLAARANPGVTVNCSNRLRFDFLTPPAVDRVYLARLQISPEFTQDQTPFLCVTNLRKVVAAGGFVNLPGITNAAPSAPYGTCEIAARLLDTSTATCPLALTAVTSSNLVLATRVQTGTRVRDEIQFAAQIPATNWSVVVSFEYEAEPDPASFDTGWQPVEWSVDPALLPQASEHFFRLKRTWLAW